MENIHVIKLLEYYSKINKYIILCEEDIKALEEMYYLPQSVDAGEARAVNKISNITENLALNVPEQVKEDIAELKADILLHKQAKEFIKKSLQKLNYQQYMVIKKFYINKYTWLKISKELNYSERQCKNIRQDAISSIKKDLEAMKKDCPLFPFFCDIIGIRKNY